MLVTIYYCLRSGLVSSHASFPRIQNYHNSVACSYGEPDVKVVHEYVFMYLHESQLKNHKSSSVTSVSLMSTFMVTGPKLYEDTKLINIVFIICFEKITDVLIVH